MEPRCSRLLHYTSGSTGVPNFVITRDRLLSTLCRTSTGRFCGGPEHRCLGLLLEPRPSTVSCPNNTNKNNNKVCRAPCRRGTLVLPEHGPPGRPSRWTSLAAEHRLSILELGAGPAPYALRLPLRVVPARHPGVADVSLLRLALVSGDWESPSTLPDHVRTSCGLDSSSLGGATEARLVHRLSLGDVPPAGGASPTPAADEPELPCARHGPSARARTGGGWEDLSTQKIR